MAGYGKAGLAEGQDCAEKGGRRVTELLQNQNSCLSAPLCSLIM